MKEYRKILTKQDNKCDLCRAVLCNNKNTHVDHCHKTGRVRGILCNRCNMGIGLFDEDVEKLKAAIAYLEE